MQRSKLKHRYSTSVLLEALESRQHLAVDLVGVFGAIKLPGTTLVPGDKFTAPIIVSNSGDETASGVIQFRLVASLDNVVDANDVDIAPRINLANFSLPSAKPKTFTFKAVIPTTIAAGAYHILAQIDSANEIAESNEGNNIVSQNAGGQLLDRTIAYRFGDFDGRKSVKLTLPDDNAPSVTFGMTGGGFGEVVQSDTSRNLVINPTGANAAVTMTSPGTAHTTINNVTVNGSLKSFTAQRTDLSGVFTATGTIGTVSLGDIFTDSAINVGAGTSTSTTTFTLGNVFNLDLNSGTPIKTLTVREWVDGNSGTEPDLLTAPSIATLSATVGNFEPVVLLTNPGNAATALGKATVKGTLRGRWTVMGGAGSISATEINSFFHSSFQGAVGSVSATTDFSGGFFAAPTFKSFAFKGIANLLVVYAGTQLGADGAFGGTGLNADQFAAGRIDKITVGGEAGMFINTGLNPGNSIVGDGDDTVLAGSTLKALTIGGAFNSGNVVATNLPASVSIERQKINPANDNRFGSTPIVFSNVPPTVTAVLAVDDGPLPDDHETSNPAVNVTITHGYVLASFFVGFSSLSDIAISLPGDSFTLSEEQLTAINGGLALTNGNYTLNLQAVDALGNRGPLTTLSFTLNREAALSAASTITAVALDASTYRYSVTLDNTGNTTIGSFWFAWIPGANFMPDSPTNIQPPAGWSSIITHENINDGYGILWTAPAPISPASPVLTFQFDSTTTPAEMAGIAAGHPGVPVLRSFVYIGAPFDDAGFVYDITPQFV